MNLKQLWVWAIVLVMLSLGGFLYYEKVTEARPQSPAPVFSKRARVHLDHAAFFNTKFASPQDVTRRCLECHPKAAADFMKTAHWQWLGPEEKIPEEMNPCGSASEI